MTVSKVSSYLISEILHVEHICVVGAALLMLEEEILAATVGTEQTHRGGTEEGKEFNILIKLQEIYHIE